MSLPTRKLTVTINGQRRGPLDVPEGMMMIDVLHEMLDLTGSRLGCGVGICHACVVIWDRDDQTSEEVQTCITDHEKEERLLRAMPSETLVAMLKLLLKFSAGVKVRPASSVLTSAISLIVRFASTVR